MFIEVVFVLVSGSVAPGWQRVLVRAAASALVWEQGLESPRLSPSGQIPWLPGGAGRASAPTLLCLALVLLPKGLLLFILGIWLLLLLAPSAAGSCWLSLLLLSIPQFGNTPL